jgi:hypothetical protein
MNTMNIMNITPSSMWYQNPYNGKFFGTIRILDNADAVELIIPGGDSIDHYQIIIMMKSTTTTTIPRHLILRHLFIKAMIKRDLFTQINHLPKFNNWRFINNEKTEIEMQLDGPGSEDINATVLFNREHLELMQSWIWICVRKPGRELVYKSKTDKLYRVAICSEKYTTTSSNSHHILPRPDGVSIREMNRRLNLHVGEVMHIDNYHIVKYKTRNTLDARNNHLYVPKRIELQDEKLYKNKKKLNRYPKVKNNQYITRFYQRRRNMKDCHGWRVRLPLQTGGKAVKLFTFDDSSDIANERAFLKALAYRDSKILEEDRQNFILKERITR